MSCFDGFPLPSRDEDEDEDESPLPWDTEGDLDFLPEDEGWTYGAGWPEENAGPEYWLLRGMADEEDDDDDPGG